MNITSICIWAISLAWASAIRASIWSRACLVKKSISLGSSSVGTWPKGRCDGRTVIDMRNNKVMDNGQEPYFSIRLVELYTYLFPGTGFSSLTKDVNCMDEMVGHCCNENSSYRTMQMTRTLTVWGMIHCRNWDSRYRTRFRSWNIFVDSFLEIEMYKRWVNWVFISMLKYFLYYRYL